MRVHNFFALLRASAIYPKHIQTPEQEKPELEHVQPINRNSTNNEVHVIYSSTFVQGRHTFLGLLAKIKCSICSYQFNIWYTGNVQYSILNEFFRGDSSYLCLHSGTEDGRGRAQRTGRPPLILLSYDHPHFYILNSFNHRTKNK